MEWILAAFALVVLAAAAVVGTGRWGSMPPVVDDRFPGLVAAGELDAAALRSAQFEVVPRGYSMTQVDALLERMATQLERDGVHADDDAPGSDHAAGPPQHPSSVEVRTPTPADAAGSTSERPSDMWRRPSSDEPLGSDPLHLAD